MPLYHLVGYNKDSHDKIISCRLMDLRTGREVQPPLEANKLKNKIKQYKGLHPNDDLVDNLSLKSDDRFQIKDNILDEYIKSCNTIGIQPLKIEKTEKGYVIVDIPDNTRNIQIPKFAQAININRKLNNRSNRENNERGNNKVVSNRDLDIKINAIVKKLGEQVNLHDRSRIALSEQKELLINILNEVSELNRDEDSDDTNNVILSEQTRLLEKILEKLEHFENNQADVNNVVDEHLKDLKDLMEEVKIDTSNEETLRMCEELKDKIEENGRDILAIKNRLETECNSLSTQYNEILNNLCSGDSSDKGILEIPKSAGFISSNTEPCFINSDRYKNVMRENNIDVYVPFDRLPILKKWLEFYYHVLTSMKLVIDSTNPSTYEDFMYLQREDDIIKSFGRNIENGLYNIRKNPMDQVEAAGISGIALSIQAAGKAVEYSGNKIVGKVISKPADILKSFNDKKKEREYCEKLELLKRQYESDEVIEGFYGETDKDTAIYVLEEKYASKNLRIKLSDGVYKKDLEYKELLKLFQNNSKIEHNRSSLDHIIFDEESRKRIALAYICARKIIRGSTSKVNGLPTEIPLIINPNTTIEELSKSELNGANEYRVKVRRLYYAIMLEIIYASLLIEGFEPKFARKEIIEKLKILFEQGIDGPITCTCGKLYDLKPSDMKNLKFDLQNYE